MKYKSKKLAIGFLMLMMLTESCFIVVFASDELGGKWPTSTVDELEYYDRTDIDEVSFMVGRWNGKNIEPYMTEIQDAEAAQVEFQEVTSKSYDGKTTLYPSSTSNPYTYCLIYICTDRLGGYTTSRIKYICGHEIGHCYGLAHEFIETAIMDPYWSAPYDPTADDVAGINGIY
jgi:hypothetical protein